MNHHRLKQMNYTNQNPMGTLGSKGLSGKGHARKVSFVAENWGISSSRLDGLAEENNSLWINRRIRRVQIPGGGKPILGLSTDTLSGNVQCPSRTLRAVRNFENKIGVTG